jgi:hypothetical protein
MNWVSEMLNKPIDLRRMYPRSYEAMRTSKGMETIFEINKKRGQAARDRILNALGDECMKTSDLLKITGQTSGGAFKRMIESMVKEGLVIKTTKGHLLYWERA